VPRIVVSQASPIVFFSFFFIEDSSPTHFQRASFPPVCRGAGELGFDGPQFSVFLFYPFRRFFPHALGSFFYYTDFRLPPNALSCLSTPLFGFFFVRNRLPLQIHHLPFFHHQASCAFAVGSAFFFLGPEFFNTLVLPQHHRRAFLSFSCFFLSSIRLGAGGPFCRTPRQVWVLLGFDEEPQGLDISIGFSSSRWVLRLYSRPHE